MGRVASGLSSYGTVNSTTLSIAFMEFLMDFDSNAMKSLWLSQGWRDISPLWGQQAGVPSFKSERSIIERWPEFQWEMTQVEADWYYISGHHSSQFITDLHRFDGDVLAFANEQEKGGFFNEPYHVGRFELGSPESPLRGARSDEVFMDSTDDTWEGGRLGPEDNPLYNAPHDQCKGVMLVGCNSLLFRRARVLLSQYFPNAVVIGLISKEANTIGRIMDVIKPLGRDFFLDPKSSISPQELAARLTPRLISVDKIGVIADGLLHFRTPTRMQAVPVDTRITKDISA